MADDPVIGWLLDPDPAVRWQVLRDRCAARAGLVGGRAA
jgi:hypothetical protein